MTEEQQRQENRSFRPRLLIKQVIGRLLLDSVKGPHPFELAPAEDGWRITVHAVERGSADEIIRLGHDLNFFYFEEPADNRIPIRKWWLYDKRQPLLSYNEAERLLSIEVDTRTAYSNDKATSG
ncbi:hypothetical protein AB6A23_07345 [Paenibacillus tarimensis]